MKKFGTITGMILWLFTFVLALSLIGPLIFLKIASNLGSLFEGFVGFSAISSMLFVSIIFLISPIIFYLWNLKKNGKPSNLLFILTCILGVVFMNTTITFLLVDWNSDTIQSDLENKIISVTLWTSWTYVIFGIIHDILKSNR
ncbi:hypothetical protein K6119_09695 [Paracrocinitomix mangrovi]|uniref:hypothetical protein n=1 Tax=Paracrocinitomix mangrovi TaxID=2862509 RepID=UPI001C8DCD6C|nr:hypothetical protein [Paracrocinitomix mangrovi]UKN03762.1 hypothetical protein K6119_09695 [Paracrocinitomix mangrovi]